MTDHGAGSNSKIDKVQTTSDNLTSRSGLAFVPPYLEQIGLLDRLDQTFGSIRKIDKGITIKEAFKQMICFFIDGTDYHLTRFDELAEMEGYQKIIQTPPDQMASSHQIKRFLRGFSFVRNFHFRSVFQDQFIWRIKREQPSLIVLDLDTMVMNNDDALQREGVEPTYKEVRGFQPLFLKYDGLVADGVLRKGSKHSNHGKTAHKMVRHLVKRIRQEYDPHVPILITSDGGFYDGSFFESLEELNVGYIIGGRLDDNVEEFVETFSEDQWEKVQKENGSEYEVLEYLWRCEEWEKSRRCLLSKRVCDGGQLQLEFAQQKRVYVTNLGINQTFTQQLRDVGKGKLEEPAEVLKLAHGRGESELTHRSIKEFGTEKLPMVPFEPNNAYFNIMILSYNFWRAFQVNMVPEEVLSSNCQPDTFRRKFLDVAGKVVETGRYTILKVTDAIHEQLFLEKIWEKVHSPPDVVLC